MRRRRRQPSVFTRLLVVATCAWPLACLAIGAFYYTAAIDASEAWITSQSFGVRLPESTLIPLPGGANVSTIKELRTKAKSRALDLALYNGLVWGSLGYACAASLLFAGRYISGDR